MIIISIRDSDKELAAILKEIKELKQMAGTFQDTLDEVVQDEVDEKVALADVKATLLAINAKVQAGLDQITALTAQLGNSPTPAQLQTLKDTADALKVDTQAIVDAAVAANPPVTP